MQGHDLNYGEAVVILLDWYEQFWKSSILKLQTNYWEIQGKIKFSESERFKTASLAKLILLQYCLTSTVWSNSVSEWVYFAITRNNIIQSAVYNYNMLLPGI